MGTPPLSSAPAAGASRPNSGFRRVLLIGLDAAEPSLIEEGCGEGRLPNLRDLRSRGSYGRLTSPALLLSGSPWPTFYTGRSPSVHGLYHHMQWRTETSRLERPNDRWLPLLPFWRAFPPSGPRAVVLDAPMTYPPAPFGGFEVAGWATHDRLGAPGSHPRRALRDLRRAFGGMLVREEVHGPQKMRDLLALGDDLVEATKRVTSASIELMRREPWDLFFVSFGASHRGGHKLWDGTAVRGAAGEAEVGAIRDSLRKIYSALDEAVGALIGAAAGETAAIVFSLHGMGPNRNRAVILPEMVRRVLARSRIGSAEGVSERGLSRLRGSVPPVVRTGVKGRLPVALRDRLTAFWVEAAGARRPASAFPLPADLHGYVRINLIGRDPKGIVPAGSLDALCDEIREGLMTFRDAGSGEAVVEDVIRLDRMLGAGDRSDRLPDLIVRWSETPSARHEALVSERFRTIRWPIPGRNPDGRAGNHREEGFVLAAGRSIPAGGRVEGGTILDLAPTILALLGAPRPFPMEGNALGPIAAAG